LGELEARARKLLPQMAYDYYAGGAAVIGTQSVSAQTTE